MSLVHTDSFRQMHIRAHSTLRVNKDNSFWDKVIFSDESKFNVFGSDGQNYVWKKPNTKFEIRHLHQTVEHGSGLVYGVGMHGCQ